MSVHALLDSFILAKKQLPSTSPLPQRQLPSSLSLHLKGSKQNIITGVGGKLNDMPLRVRRWVVAATLLCTIFLAISAIGQKNGMLDFRAVYVQTNRHSTSSSLPYQTSRFTGNTDLLSFQKPSDKKIVALIFAGRREFVKILDCYLQRNLVRNGGWLDRVQWVIRTDVPYDVEYLNHLIENTPEYQTVKVDLSTPGYSEAYQSCERDTIYIKIDDDVVFWEDHTIPAIVKRKVENPQYLAVSANVINQPALSWVHYHLNTAKPYLPETMKPADFDEDELSRNTKLDWRPSKMPTITNRKMFDFNETYLAPFKGHRWLRLEDSVDLEQTPMGILGEGAHKEYSARGSGWHSWAVAAQGTLWLMCLTTGRHSEHRLLYWPEQVLTICVLHVGHYSFLENL